MVNARITSIIHNPGGKIYHQIKEADPDVKPNCRMRPQLRIEESPRPIKARNASARIDLAIVMSAVTRIKGIM